MKTNSIQFVVPQQPVPQPRERSRVVWKKELTDAFGECLICNEFLTCRKCTDQKPIAMLYTPEKDPVNLFKREVRLAARRAYQGKPIDGPLELWLTFIFPRPKIRRWKTKPMPRTWYIKTPDVDNLAKAVMDALTGLIWHDDKQVARSKQDKFEAAGLETPMVAIAVESLEGEPTTSWADELIKAESNW